jgi:hypothetical protein
MLGDLGLYLRAFRALLALFHFLLADHELSSTRSTLLPARIQWKS